MHRWVDCYAPLIGRIFVGGFFLWQAIQSAINFGTTVQIFSNAMWIEPALVAAIVIAIEAVGGISLVVGKYMRLSASALAIFMTVASVFWIDHNSSTSIAIFMQNMAITGGLLCIAAAAPSSWRR